MQFDLFEISEASPVPVNRAAVFPVAVQAIAVPAVSVAARRPVFSVFADITCGDACWHAREDVCRCSCGGKNHGCLRGATGEAQPVRTAKIDGERYELAGVGGHSLYAAAERVNMAAGWARIDRSMPTYPYHYHWKDTDAGAPARVKPASKSQRALWTELQGCAEAYPLLFWKRVEQPATANWCAVPCESCDRQKAKLAKL